MKLVNALGLLAASLVNHHQAAALPERVYIPFMSEIFPISQLGCTWHKLDMRDFVMAKEKMLLWAAEDGKVAPRSMRAITHGSVTWYICNCKLLWWDGLEYMELDTAERRMKKDCGEHVSGWAWSQEWNKGWGVEHTDFVKRGSEEMCPDGCFSVW